MTRRRIFGWSFILLGLLAVSIGIAAARDFRPPNPYDMSPGIREEGRYTMIVPGTYGHLIPILPFPFTKGDGGGKPGDTSTQSATARSGSAGPLTIDGKRPPVIRIPSPIAPGGPKSPGSLDGGVGSVLSPTGSGGSHTDGLESRIREAIDKLHSR
jgi:hypothetical protein